MANEYKHSEEEKMQAAGPSEEVVDPASDIAERDLDFILDIPLELSVELGRSRMLVNDLLQLGQGSIVELNKLAGEPLEIYINRKLVARGEVVVVNEKFGVRLTDIISPMERVRTLA
ncbi:flagellar motor switch protein FliN [Desulfobotulus pelophilus]|uniref:flagellar motor switch protein FliN n=1 Tax=Desulfobotulus pelophilus TaxID=2823377 RepID=UPI0026E590AC|nr:flagellar motor switch protein FliN [Desulfobotulus pelophilus]